MVFFFLIDRDHSTSLEMHIAHLQKRITAMKALLDVSMVDNRTAQEEEEEEEEEGLSQRLKNSMQVVEDHPLSTSKSGDSVFSDSASPLEGTITSSFQLRREIDSVSLDWRSLRNIKECVCSTPFDHSSKKVSLVHHRHSSSSAAVALSSSFFFFHLIDAVALLEMRRGVLYAMSR